MPTPFTPGLCPQDRPYPQRRCGGQGVGAGRYLGRGNELHPTPGSGPSAQLVALEEASLLVCWFVWGVMPDTCCNASLAGAISPSLSPFWFLRLAFLSL